MKSTGVQTKEFKFIALVMVWRLVDLGNKTSRSLHLHLKDIKISTEADYCTGYRLLR